MVIINKTSNGIPVSEGRRDDICTVNAWLRQDLWEVRNNVYTHKVDSFSDFWGHFKYENINEFIDSLTSTGKYAQICISYSDSR